MITFFIFLLTSFLLFTCGFVVLLILMQRPSDESGMGSTLGGGAVTSVFGGEAVNTLAKITKYCVIIFFLLSFTLSLLHMSLEKVIKSQNLLEKKSIATEVLNADISTEDVKISEEIAYDEEIENDFDDDLIEDNFDIGDEIDNKSSIDYYDLNDETENKNLTFETDDIVGGIDGEFES